MARIGEWIMQKEHSHIMLLQGPVGPFFAELHDALVAQGHSVDRVIFNAGDSVFSARESCLRFSGDLAAWETWLRFRVARNTPDAIVLFGSSRPLHEIARRIAGCFGIDAICLEEGYLRSGYIACETGGNNQYSALAHWTARHRATGAWPTCPDVSPAGSPSFATMSLWGALYYLVRDLLSDAADEALFHRPKERPLTLAVSWLAHITRRLIANVTELPRVRRLRARRGYMLVPLQVPTDSQLLLASRGWNTLRLVDACLQAILRSGPNQRIIFKLHPLDRDGPSVRRRIRHRANELGLSRSRVQILNTGRIGELARNASGMVVINSTSAFSALHHDVPVLVLGDAVCRHDSVVTTGETESDVEAFFKIRHAKRRDMIDAFLADLKAQTLLAGDFYVASGRKTAIAGIIARLTQLHAPTYARKGAQQ
ncbi:hypothetical protein [Tabrizicola sp.]|uniref:capsular polysaccharide export protein, LipB/KpsS family n=1 Tax=Tabrizicola sp. TaxID=2005166 RepID=UPI00345606A1